MFYYVDRWSSSFTWNNSPPPKEGDVVVIGDKLQVMLDQITPVLNMIVIYGGMLFFDRTQDLELKAKYTVIINNGRLQIGTENEPHPTGAIVTLYGRVCEKELPLFGSKVLAVRNGSLELNGMFRVTMKPT
ncbi:Fibrocystin-L [Fasciola hepatica]|uniref:Fibrocystin-L n=1 Tax=Fasciola hepatica TaxID=6192 RepID=A0A2H1CWI3_FASHE|nr:Fibrocystin-L [Fasciola hepatica]